MSDEKKNAYQIVRRKLLTRIGFDREDGGNAEEDDDRKRILSKTERLLDTLNRMGATMEKVADIQLQVAQRLLPIVEDLGQLVKHSLRDITGSRSKITEVKSPPRDSPTGSDASD